MNARRRATDRARRVLLVDDNPMERFLAREALEQSGLEVEEAGDGAEALRVFERRVPDVVLLDVKMPGMGGFECCRLLRAREDGAFVPVLMLTGLDDVDSINAAYEAGATDFYAKPINAAVLSHRVRYLLRSSHTSEELRRSRSQLAHAQRMAGLGSWEWSGSADDARWSSELETILGGPPDFEGAAVVLARHVHAEDRPRYEAAMRSVFVHRESVSLEHRIVRPDDSTHVVHHEVDVLPARDDAPPVLVGVMQDISERRASEERIRYLAYYDTVTGLPNRTLLGEHLSRTIAGAERCGGAMALLFLDIDRFKRINDTHGHTVGDELLREVATRLRRCVRDGDYVSRELAPCEASATTQAEEENAVSRLGGDEFVIVLSDVRGVEDAARVAKRVQAAFNQPFRVVDQDIHVSTSIGISGYPGDGTDADTLLKNADAAMYHAKAAGRDRYQFFTAEMNERAARRLDLETALRVAVHNDELLLHYQPIVCLASGRTVGVEALVRWDRPGHGLISPGEFIPIAEESRLIVRVGEWVLERACTDMAALAADGLDDVRVAVNLSAVQFAAPGLSALVAGTLQATSLPAERLELELTESVLMNDVETSAAMLAGLKRLGVHIAIDDFGTGYSSLAYLKRFPIDTLKIDRSFIRDIADDPDDASIVSATIGLARSLRLGVVAEGVEAREQVEFLSDNGCDRCQGYLLAKPMPLAELRRWLAGEPQPGTAPFAGRALEVVS